MKKLISILFLSFSVLLYSQVSALVQYIYSQKKQDYLNEVPAISLYENNAYLYTLQNSKVGVDPAQMIAEIDAGKCDICNENKPIIFKKEDRFILKRANDTEQILYFDVKMSKKHYVVRDTVRFEWRLTNEKDTILGYICQSAETLFRGRNYKVYYTTEIPITVGPWKFQGLPGLILRAASSDNYFVYEAIAITFNKKEEIKIPAILQESIESDSYINGFQSYKSIANKLYKEKQKAVESGNDNPQISISLDLPNTQECIYKLESTNSK